MSYEAWRKLRDEFDLLIACESPVVVRRCVEIIKAIADDNDDETAPRIAARDGESEFGEMARLALTTGDIEFARWCA